MSKLIQRAAVTILAVATFSLSGPTNKALAVGGSTLGCVVYDIGNDTNGTRITLHCNGDSNTYSTNYGGCSTVGPDQVKTWASMIMSAFLAGKKLNIWWDDDCGSRAITGLYITSVP